MDVSAARMNVGSTLFSHMPLASMPFQTHNTVIFETPAYLDPAKAQIDLDRVIERKRHNSAYTYHPINRPHRQGEVVDFIIA